MSAKCLDLKSCIESLESDFSQQLQELTSSLERNEERYSEDHRLTQEKIMAISEKVYETRQIISGASVGSKVSMICLATSRLMKVCRCPRWRGRWWPRTGPGRRSLDRPGGVQRKGEGR